MGRSCREFWTRLGTVRLRAHRIWTKFSFFAKGSVSAKITSFSVLVSSNWSCLNRVSIFDKSLELSQKWTSYVKIPIASKIEARGHLILWSSTSHSHNKLQIDAAHTKPVWREFNITATLHWGWNFSTYSAWHSYGDLITWVNLWCS